MVNKSDYSSTTSVKNDIQSLLNGSKTVFKVSVTLTIYVIGIGIEKHYFAICKMLLHSLPLKFKKQRKQFSIFFMYVCMFR
jgi:hypothetical protein